MATSERARITSTVWLELPALPEPWYRRVLIGFRQLLVQGKLKPGDHLPTSRDLADTIGVNHNTVARAYRELARDGWLRVRRHEGVVVLARKPPTPDADVMHRLRRRVVEAIGEARAAGASDEAVTAELRILAGDAPRKRS